MFKELNVKNSEVNIKMFSLYDYFVKFSNAAGFISTKFGFEKINENKVYYIPSYSNFSVSIKRCDQSKSITAEMFYFTSREVDNYISIFDYVSVVSCVKESFLDYFELVKFIEKKNGINLELSKKILFTGVVFSELYEKILLCQDRKLFNRIIYTLKNEIKNTWDVKLLSKKTYLTESKIKNELKKNNVTFSYLLKTIRLKKASKILKNGSSVKEACYAVGYNCPNYFSREFKNYFGVKASQFSTVIK
ncbi:hypothetical protein BA894_22840 [Vibrio natriegens]|uniref:helix-turn-helix transcriptional regulator n=1 Tax=Vibrio natriegens TaxID=691 RepID=UPI00080467A9|nr:helix-turn-helix transcriptional regulator [Vibrio natriegens]ANQ29232.1 hypothetical protein BA894_22840 [Vibrio natriegens]